MKAITLKYELGFSIMTKTSSTNRLVTIEELHLIKKLAEVSEKRGLFKTENYLFRKLTEKKNG